ncbi:MAG: hypothetical protein ABI054_14330 [Planctomycetota bacterium]
MKNVALSCLALGLLVSLPGCHSDGNKTSKQEKIQQEQAAMKASIPADSPLAKVEFGMSEGEVGSILGPPTSQGGHITGKQFVPFNFAAKDTSRTVYYYKGIGRLEFSSGSWGQRNGVVVIQHDPTEPGFRR